VRTVDAIQVPMHGPGSWDHASPADWANVLATFPLFSEIGKRQLRKLVRRATFAEYGRGDIVIQKGEPGESLHVILGGSAKALGKPASRTLRTGDYFGELSLLDGFPRSATVIATGDLHVMKLPRQDFLRLTQDDPSVSFKMVTTLGSQIRRLETQPAMSTR
jgi:CRP/FNR family transcriptional regulator, cyclic AMP receptor protein